MKEKRRMQMKKMKERRPDEHIKERAIKTDEQQTKNNREREKKAERWD